MREPRHCAVRRYDCVRVDDSVVVVGIRAVRQEGGKAACTSSTIEAASNCHSSAAPLLLELTYVKRCFSALPHFLVIEEARGTFLFLG